MSRHRAVRNMDLEDVLDEEEQFSSDYDENQLDESQLSNEDLDALEEGLDYVYGVIGQDVPLTDMEIKEALWYYYFDKEETVNWALEKIDSLKTEEDKRKAKEAKKQAAAKEPRKPCYRRPPAKMYIDSMTLSTLPAKSLTSLQSLSKSATKSTTSLSSLASRSKPASTTSSLKTSSGGSLLSLAQKSAGQRNMTALQSLANRQQSSPAASNTTLSSLAKQSSSLNNTNKNDKQQSTSLTHLATRSTSQSSSLAALASSSTRKVTSGLVGSGTTSALKKSMTDDGVTSAQVLPTKNHTKAKTTTTATSTSTVKNPTLTTTQVPGSDLRNMISQSARKTTNPLVASPSPAAVFLFRPHNEQTRSPLADSIMNSLPHSLAQAFYDAMPSSVSSTTKLFKFDAPSPDDIVMAAQSQRNTKTKKLDPIS